MIKKKLLTAGLMTAMVFALTACGGGQQAPVTVVTSSENQVEVTSEPATEPEEEVTEPVEETEEPEAEEIAGLDDVETNQEEITGDTTIEEEGAAEDIAEETDNDNLLTGTQIGISGTNCYVMVDGKGLLLDFSGLGLLSTKTSGEHIIGAQGLCTAGSITFTGYSGKIGADRSKYEDLGDEKVGDYTVERYWNAQYGIYEAYCEALDCSIVGQQGEWRITSDEALEIFDTYVLEHLAAFDATQK